MASASPSERRMPMARHDMIASSSSTRACTPIAGRGATEQHPGIPLLDRRFPEPVPHFVDERQRRAKVTPGDDVRVAAPAITIESLAGDFSWVLKTERGDSVLNEGVLHQNPDGSGWTLATKTPGDTIRYTSAMVGDTLITTSAPCKDSGMLEAAGELVFRAGGVPTGAATRTAMITVSPPPSPTPCLRARAWS